MPRSTRQYTIASFDSSRSRMICWFYLLKNINMHQKGARSNYTKKQHHKHIHASDCVSNAIVHWRERRCHRPEFSAPLTHKQRAKPLHASVTSQGTHHTLLKPLVAKVPSHSSVYTRTEQNKTSIHVAHHIAGQNTQDLFTHKSLPLTAVPGTINGG